jgi:DNA-binding GntR family transcriptional regulator
VNAFPQVKPVSIRQSVGAAIRRALLEGRFHPGQALSEVAIAAEMNVSRGPVREALLVLAHEGLVTHSQNYGFSVLNFTERDRREIQQVRSPLETLALELAREHVTNADISELTLLTRRMVTAFQERQFLDCTQADLEFHTLIWDRSGNSRLDAALRNLMVPYFAYGSAFKLARPDLTPELLEAQHLAYIDYLRGTSESTAEACVRFHTGL